MGNTHPPDHVPLWRFSAALGVNPEASVFSLLNFSSSLLFSLPGRSLRNFDTRSLFSSAQQKLLRSVGLRGTTPLT